jgi:hypothetical protein
VRARAPARARRSGQEIVAFEDEMVLYLHSANEMVPASMAPFIERFIQGRIAQEVLDLTPEPIPTCLYRETEEEKVGPERRTFIVDCATPHQGELYHHGSIAGDPASPYPGDAAVDADASRQCLDAFGPYVGRDFNSSRLSYLYFCPNGQTWAGGDRGVECLVYAGDGEELVRGSMAGTAE